MTVRKETPPANNLDKYEIAIDMIEQHKPYPGMTLVIDDCYAQLKTLFAEGMITEADFSEWRSRLWSRREDVCESLLPEGQRAKTGNKIF